MTYQIPSERNDHLPIVVLPAFGTFESMDFPNFPGDAPWDWNILPTFTHKFLRAKFVPRKDPNNIFMKSMKVLIPRNMGYKVITPKNEENVGSKCKYMHVSPRCGVLRSSQRRWRGDKRPGQQTFSKTAKVTFDATCVSKNRSVFVCRLSRYTRYTLEN